ncbi:MAG: copper transporter [Acidimicrobiales bacterium]
MINFRFHLVSITAIFLALAAGIAVGAAVVDRASVDLLRTQLDEVEGRRTETNARNDELKDDIDRWDRFATEAGVALYGQYLSTPTGGLPVALVAVDGVDRASVGALEAALARAGAAHQGTLWLTSRWLLSDESAITDLAAAIKVNPTLTADTVRRAAVSKIGKALVDGGAADVLVSLDASGFLDFTPTAGGETLGAVPSPDATIIFISGPSAYVSDTILALPIVRTISSSARSLIVAQPGAPAVTAKDDRSFVGRIRSDRDLAAALTTVDSLDDLRGRTAAVMAVRTRAAGVNGHFGIGRGAQRVVPEIVVPPA